MKKVTSLLLVFLLVFSSFTIGASALVKDDLAETGASAMVLTINEQPKAQYNFGDTISITFTLRKKTGTVTLAIDNQEVKAYLDGVKDEEHYLGTGTGTSSNCNNVKISFAKANDKYIPAGEHYILLDYAGKKTKLYDYAAISAESNRFEILEASTIDTQIVYNIGDVYRTHSNIKANLKTAGGEPIPGAKIRFIMDDIEGYDITTTEEDFMIDLYDGISLGDHGLNIYFDGAEIDGVTYDACQTDSIKFTVVEDKDATFQLLASVQDKTKGASITNAGGLYKGFSAYGGGLASQPFSVYLNQVDAGHKLADMTTKSGLLDIGTFTLNISTANFPLGKNNLILYWAGGVVGDDVYKSVTKSYEFEVSAKITYNANGGSVDPSNETIKANKAVADLPTPIRDGYDFKAWTTEKDNLDTAVTGEIDDNITLYAYWEEEASETTTPSETKGPKTEYTTKLNIVTYPEVEVVVGKPNSVTLQLLDDEDNPVDDVRVYPQSHGDKITQGKTGADGKITFDLSALPVGDYSFNFHADSKSTDDKSYEASSSDEVTFKVVDKTESSIKITTQPKDTIIGNDVTITAELIEKAIIGSLAKGISGTVKAYLASSIDECTETTYIGSKDATTIIGAAIPFTFTVSGLEAGDYNITLVFEGNADYKSSYIVSDKFHIDLEGIQTSIDITTQPQTIEYGDTNKIAGKLTANGEGLGNVTLSFYLVNGDTSVLIGTTPTNNGVLGKGKFEYEFSTIGEAYIQIKDGYKIKVVSSETTSGTKKYLSSEKESEEFNVTQVTQKDQKVDVSLSSNKIYKTEGKSTLTVKLTDKNNSSKTLSPVNLDIFVDRNTEQQNIISLLAGSTTYDFKAMDLPAGEHTIEVYSHGINHYNSAWSDKLTLTVEKSITIYKIDLSFNIQEIIQKLLSGDLKDIKDLFSNGKLDIDKTEVNEGEDTEITIKANLFAHDGTLLNLVKIIDPTKFKAIAAGQKVKFEINGQEYFATTDENGVATLVFNSKDLFANDYEVTATYAGDEANYQEAANKATCSFKVKGPEVDLSFDDESILTYANPELKEAKINVGFDNFPSREDEIEYEIVGTDISGKVSIPEAEGGFFTLDLSSLDASKGTLLDKEYYTLKVTAKRMIGETEATYPTEIDFRINKASTTIELSQSKDEVEYKKTHAKFTVTLKDEFGQPVKGATVIFEYTTLGNINISDLLDPDNIDLELGGIGVTDENGEYSKYENLLTCLSWDPGTYNGYAQFLGNDNYNLSMSPLFNPIKFTVTKATSKLTLSVPVSTTYKTEGEIIPVIAHTYSTEILPLELLPVSDPDVKYDVYIDGEVFTTIDSPSYTIKANDFSAGEHTIQIKARDGKYYYDVESEVKNFKVVNSTTKFDSNVNVTPLSVRYGKDDTCDIEATLLYYGRNPLIITNRPKPLEGKVVKFYVDSVEEGNLIGSATTDADGLAKLEGYNTKDLVDGSHVVYAAFEDTDIYLPCDARTALLKPLVVYSPTVTGKVKSASYLEYGTDYMSQAEFTLTFTEFINRLDDVKYKVKENEEVSGTATVKDTATIGDSGTLKADLSKLDAGDYTLVVTATDDSNGRKEEYTCEIKFTINRTDSKTSVSVEPNKTRLGKEDKVVITAKSTYGNNKAISGEIVEFYIDSMTGTSIGNAKLVNGVATLEYVTSSLDLGGHTIYAVLPECKNFNTSNGNTRINIVDPSVIVLVPDRVFIYGDEELAEFQVEFSDFIKRDAKVEYTVSNGEGVVLTGDNEIDAEDTTGIVKFDLSDVDAGEYKLVVKATDSSQSTQTYESEEVSFTINPKTLEVTWSDLEFTYDKEAHIATATATNLEEGDTCEIHVFGRDVDAGTHRAVAETITNKNYKLPENCETIYTINPAPLTLTYGQLYFTYDGKEHIPEVKEVKGLIGDDTTEITLSGAQVLEGKYTATAKPSNSNYYVPKTRSFQINEAIIILKPTKIKSKSIKATWNKNAHCDKYVVYASRCGEDWVKVGTVKDNTFTLTKIGKTALKAHTFYKIKVKGYRKGEYIKQSKLDHIITGNTKGKVANATKVTPNKTTVTIKVGETITLSAKTTIYKNMQAVSSGHGKQTRYFTQNKNIATVSSKGVIKAKHYGTTKVYVQNLDGIYTAVTVKVVD